MLKPFIFLSFLFLALPFFLPAQQANHIINQDSSLHSLLSNPNLSRDSILQSLLTENQLLNSGGKPVALSIEPRKQKSKEAIFYLLAGLLLFLAISRYLYSRYFSNLFRVFFNTSLRQSQLTDQLLQAKFPSLLFNFFFITSGGLFIYFLLLQNGWNREQMNWVKAGACILLLGLVYGIKFWVLKFTGWITGYRNVTNTYIFIFFLINKILGIFLVPFVILLALADISLVNPSILIALIIIGFFVLLRFIRSYSLIQTQLKISKLHFFLYIAGVEILPLLLIYKGLVILLNKNL